MIKKKESWGCPGIDRRFTAFLSRWQKRNGFLSSTNAKLALGTQFPILSELVANPIKKQ